MVISNPKASTAPLLDLISKSGSFSGYRINWVKSELLPLSQLVDKAFPKTIPFKIVLDKSTSLSIIVTRNWAS